MGWDDRGMKRVWGEVVGELEGEEKEVEGVVGVGWGEVNEGCGVRWVDGGC